MTYKLKIGKVIDKGLLNSVNECTLNGIKYIVKIEHVTQKEQNNKKSPIFNEINFSLNFAIPTIKNLSIRKYRKLP